MPKIGETPSEKIVSQVRPRPPIRAVSQSDNGPATIGPIMPSAAASRPNCRPVSAGDRPKARLRKEGVNPMTP